jgi:hypothetical protein
VSSLREFLTAAATSISRAFEQFGRVHPTYFMIAEDGRPAMFLAPPGDWDTSVSIARLQLKTAGATRVVFADVGWQALCRGKEEIARGAWNHPNRVEVLIFQGEDSQEGELTGRRVITRVGNNVSLGPLEIERFARSEGRMIGLLPSRGKAN